MVLWVTLQALGTVVWGFAAALLSLLPLAAPRTAWGESESVAATTELESLIKGGVIVIIIVRVFIVVTVIAIVIDVIVFVIVAPRHVCSYVCMYVCRMHACMHVGIYV